MQPKTVIFIGMIVGTTLGGLIPSLWGEGMFSMSSIIFTALGGVAGIYVGYRLSR